MKNVGCSFFYPLNNICIAELITFNIQAGQIPVKSIKKARGLMTTNSRKLISADMSDPMFVRWSMQDLLNPFKNVSTREE